MRGPYGEGTDTDGYTPSEQYEIKVLWELQSERTYMSAAIAQVYATLALAAATAEASES